MTSKEIRHMLPPGAPLTEIALFEIAAQLAELNERVSDGGIPVQVVGAASIDLHTLTVAAASLPRRRRY